jgi:hypothetical protein
MQGGLEMGDSQALIKIDRKLAEEIDSFVGDRQRTKFVNDVVERALKKLRLQHWLAHGASINLAADDPRSDAAVWVRNQRQAGADSDRAKRIESQRNDL